MYINFQNKNKFLNQYSIYCISPDSLTPRIANWTRRSKVGNFRQGGARRSQPGRNISFVTGVRIIYLSFLLAFSLALSKVRGLSSAQQLKPEGGATCCCWGWEGAGGGIGGGGIDVSQCWVGKTLWRDKSIVRFEVFRNRSPGSRAPPQIQRLWTRERSMAATGPVGNSGRIWMGKYYLSVIYKTWTSGKEMEDAIQ